ncbi:MAG: protein kinase [bacterium]|nr:protein kinase [bacterium]
MESARDDSILFDFVHRLFQDIQSGDVRPLEEYLERYPGHDESIAAEYKELVHARRGPKERVRTIGPYRLVGELGRGGQGAVYLAEDMRLSRRVALKILTSPLGTVPQKRRMRLRREAEVVARLDHPDICDVFDADLEAEVPYIAMRYVEGKPLDVWIALAREGKADEADAEAGTFPTCLPKNDVELHGVLRFFERVAHALHVAHEAGVVHRDVKPGNLMVTPQGAPVVLDFGLAREISGHLQSITRTGELFGTMAYVAPEQLAGRHEEVDGRADVHALATVLFECVTLRKPFDAEAHEALRHQILHETPAPARTLNPRLPRDLEVVLGAALEKDPSRRYQTARAFADDLRRVREYEPIRARPAGPVMRLRRWSRRHPRVALSLAGALFVLTVGLVTTLVLLRQKQETLARFRGAYFRDLASQHAASTPAMSLDLSLRAADLDPGYRSNQAIFSALRRLRVDHILPMRGMVKAVALSPDGATVLAANEHGEIDLWNTCTGVLERNWQAHDAWIQALAFSPDSARCVSAGQDNVARIHALDDRREPLVLRGHSDWIADVCFSPDGTRVLTGAEDGTAAVWDAVSGERLFELSGHEGVVRYAIFDAAGERILTGSGEPFRPEPDRRLGSDHTARLYDATDGTWLCTFAGHTQPLTSIALSADGSRALTAALDGTARIWRTSDGLELHRIARGKEVKRAVFSPDGERAAIAWGPTDFDDPGLGIFETASGEHVFDLVGHAHRVVWDVAYDESGTRIASLSSDRTLRIWDAATGAETHTFPLPSITLRLTWLPGGDRVLAGYWSGACHIWNLDENRILPVLGDGTRAVVRARWSADGERIVSAAEDGASSVWERGQRVQRIDAGGTPTWVDFDPTGEFVLMATKEGTSRVTRVADGARMADLKGHTAPVVDAAFDRAGGRVATASTDGTARVWSVPDGALLATFDAHEGALGCIAWSPDDESIATGAADRTARTWSAADGTQELVFGPFEARSESLTRVFDVVFHPTQPVLALASEENAVRLFDTRTGRLRQTLRSGTVGKLAFDSTGRKLAVGRRWSGWVELHEPASGLREQLYRHDSTITEVAFSADDALLLTTSLDGQARLWTTAPFEPWAAFDHPAGVIDGSFSPDGSHIVTACLDGTVRIFPCDLRAAGWAARPYPRGDPLALPADVDPASVE